MLKVSIITINLNNVSGLKKTLESIAEQSFKDYEQIIIDGGSSDGSQEVILSFKDTSDKNFLWQSEPDTGVYNAMNKGISYSNGEYCFFLNSGDYFHDNKVLESIFTYPPDSDVIYGDLVVYKDGLLEGVSKGKGSITFLDLYIGIIKHQASFIRKELFEKYGLYDETLKIVADWAFFLNVVGIQRASAKYVELKIACFDNNGISNSNPEVCLLERQQTLDKYIPFNIQPDYILMQKYKDIRVLESSKSGWFLFRLLAKVFKVFSNNI